MLWLPFWVLSLSSHSPTDLLVRSAFVHPVPVNHRSIVHTDPLEADFIRGSTSSVAGWQPLEAKPNGWFENDALESAYVRAEVTLPVAKTMLLEAQGDSLAYVNGEIRVGDPYQYGYVSLPVSLNKGKNTLYFLCSRGRLRVNLVEPPAPISMDLRDITCPDLRPSDRAPMWAAVIVRNTTDHPLRDLFIRAGTMKSKVGDVPAMSIRKVGFQFKPADGPQLKVMLVDRTRVVDSGHVDLKVRAATEPYKRTFVSDLDGSVQYYAVNPAPMNGQPKALFLSLHGASVEAIGQAQAYSGKTWGNIVCPTNRRPYGFDWEDMGRMDALEVLKLAKQELRPDPSQIYLCGHSMGGHGTWQLGALYPDQFAAIGPSAGWISFNSYAGGSAFPGQTDREKILNRAGGSSDTLSLKQNYATEGIYVIHGDADDNVPVSEARNMRKALEPFHHDVSWYEQPGAGHWWDVSPEPGADCVDWPPLFDFFSRHRLPSTSQVLNVDFSTANPGVTATDCWITIQSQRLSGVVSRVQLHAEPYLRTVTGTTQNCRRLSLSLDALQKGPDVRFELDGQKIGPTPWPSGGTVFLEFTAGRWLVASPPSPKEKNPRRNGGFKDIFRNRVVFVVGTAGTEEENRWAIQKARFDAETLWYRGNGAVALVMDSDFTPAKFADRNVILYGNADTNRAWNSLLSHCPIQVYRHRLRIAKGVGVTDSKLDDTLAVFFIYPRSDSETASVAVISGTGSVGNQVANRVPIFLSGAHFPDAVVFNEKSVTDGLKGVLLAGYFGPDWNWLSGDWAVSPELR